MNVMEQDKTSPVFRALKRSGINDILDFIGMDFDKIDKMDYVPHSATKSQGSNSKPLNIGETNLIKIGVDFFAFPMPISCKLS